MKSDRRDHKRRSSCASPIEASLGVGMCRPMTRAAQVNNAAAPASRSKIAARRHSAKTALREIC